MLAKRKSKSSETLISHALIDLEISHKGFQTTVSEKQKYKRMKENIRMMKSTDEIDENKKDTRENRENAES